MARLSRYSIVSALVLITGASAGCGGGSGKETAKRVTPALRLSTAEAMKADTAAKTSARRLVSEMYACFVGRQTYKGCEPGRAAPGVSVSTTDLGYSVTAKSKSGAEFVVTKADDGTIERTCTTEVEGLCRSSRSRVGNW